MGRHVFISHSSKDAKIADEICGILERGGIACWIAPRDVRPGEDWDEEVWTGIENAAALLFLVSQSSNVSEIPKSELNLAVGRGIAVFPIRIEDVLPKGGLKVLLGRKHWTDAFHPPLESRLETLMETLKVYLGPTEPRMDEEVGARVVEAPSFVSQPEVTSSPAQKVEAQTGESRPEPGPLCAVIDTLGSYTRLQNVVFEEDVILQTVYDYALARDSKSKIALESFAGILVLSSGIFRKDHLASEEHVAPKKLKAYLEAGGRIFFLLPPLSTEQNATLMTYFGVTSVTEFIMGKEKGGGPWRYSTDGRRICPLFDCEIGSHLGSRPEKSNNPAAYRGPFVGSYWGIRKSTRVMEQVLRSSEETHQSRIVSCKIRQGDGEAWFVPDFTALYGDGVGVNDYPMFEDKTIGEFENVDAVRAVVRWLGGSGKRPPKDPSFSFEPGKEPIQ